MSKIPIKSFKRGSSLVKKVSDELRVNLRDDNQGANQKQSPKKGLFLIVWPVILIVIILFSLYAFYSLFLDKNNFDKIIPKQRTVFSLIDQKNLYQQIISLENGKILEAENYLGRMGLNFREDIQPLFKDRIELGLLSADQESRLPFVVVFEVKESDNEIKEILEKIELGLKQDCNYFSGAYRQTEIKTIEPVLPVFSFARSFSYALIQNYLIISNSQEAVKLVVDRVID